MNDMMTCPYGNKRCLCQICENNPVENEKSGCFPYCKDCEWKGKQIHDLWMCSKYKPKDGENENFAEITCPLVKE